MRLIIALFTVLFTALAPTVLLGCSQATLTTRQDDSNLQPERLAPLAVTTEIDAIETALKRTKIRLTNQQQWLQQLKSAESELSQPPLDYGW